MIIKTIKNIGLMEIKDDITGNTGYGFEQTWYRTGWQRNAGCGPTTVANLLHYIARSDPEAKSDGSQDTKSVGLVLMEEVWNYVTPSIQGVNTTKMLYEGTLDYAKAKGMALSYDVIDIPRKKRLRPPFQMVLDFIGHALDEDSPVAFLNLHHGKEKQLYSWHWVTILSLEYSEDAKTAIATIMDEGVLKKIDLALWYATTRIGGGFIRFKRITNQQERVIRGNQMKAIINARVVTPEKVIENGVILMEKGRIAEVGESTSIPLPEGCEIIDAKGCYAGPGLVEIHCHGGDLFEAYEEPAKMAAYHLSHGTTSLTESIAYNVSYEKTMKGIDLICEAMKDPASSIVGIFMEGPFNNPNFGASSHSGRPIDKNEYEEIYRRAGGNIRQWMYSPEIEHAEEFGKFIVSKGIPLAIGHTCASPAQIQKAVDIGATICTHLFDAMGCYLGNSSVEGTGIIQDTVADAALVTDELFLEVICDHDAVHVKPSNLKLAYKCGGPDRVVLITDCVKRAPGADTSRDININEANELSGSFLTMEKALKNMHHYTGAPITDLFKMASSNPAKAIRIYDKAGSLERGKFADVVLLDAALDLKKVFFRGEEVPVAFI